MYAPLVTRACPVVAALVATSCVVGSGSRPTRVEASRETGEGGSFDVMTVGDHRACAGVHPRPRPPAKDALWIEGSCHFDGVDFHWVEGRWESRAR